MSESPEQYNKPDTRRALANAVGVEVSQGWRVESQTDMQAILVKGKHTNHVLHGFLTLITAGLWAVIWLLFYLLNRRQTLILSVDEYGNILRNEG